MIIEIGTKYIGEDGEVVEVHNIIETVGLDEVVYYKCKQGKEHISYDYDFLEQYKPYEVVYEYQYAYYDAVSGVLITNNFYTDMEALLSVNDVNQRLDFTKRERK